MKNVLHHKKFGADGIFGEFTFEGDDEPFMVTCEHAFLDPGGAGDAAAGGTGEAGWKPIIGPGTYRCVRGVHSLEDGIAFETFEITGVDGHSGLLFHPGNFNKDSKGCVLCGQREVKQANGDDMITGSRVEFAAFMSRLSGIGVFELEVI